MLVAGCSEKEQQLTIAYSNDMLGEIRSCGCVSNDYGGLGRRATLLHNVRKTADNLILLEAGDFFGTNLNYGAEKAGLTLQAMAYMGYDGIAIGEKDLGLGIDFLVERVDALKLPVLVANLVDAETDSPIFPGSRVVTTERGLKIGLVGLLDRGFKFPRQVPEGSLRITDPNAALRRELDAMPDDVDLIFVLGHMKVGSATRLAQTHPRVDAVVCGHEARPMRRARRFGNAYVLQTSSKGRYMGLAFALLDSDRKISELGTEQRALTTDFADHEAIVKLFQSYDMEIANQERARIASGMPDSEHAKNPFAGSAACESCHEDIYAQWQETKHSHAFDILVEQGREFDRDCTPCHTTGFYEIGGFTSMVETPDLLHIGCESCHGNSSSHVKNSDVPPDGVARRACKACHNAEQTPDFEFEEFWGRIKH